MDRATELEPNEPGRPPGRRHAAPGSDPRGSWWGRPEVLFLPAFLIIGAIFIAWVPAGWNADEPAHAYRSAQIASGHLLPTVQDNPDGTTTVGGEVPRDVVALFSLTKALSAVVFDPTYKVDHLYTPAQEQASHPTGSTPADFRNTALYSPVAYVPAIAAFWVGDATGLEPRSIVDLARVLSLLTVGLAWTAAIALTPRAKWTFAAVGLLPSVVSQSAALSADGMLLAVTALFVATWASCVWRPQPPSRRAYVLMTVLAMVLGLCKIAYAPLALLVVAVPLLHRVGSRRHALLNATGMLAVAWVPAVAWSLLTRAANVSLNPTADIAAQTAWIKHHPFGFAHVLYATFLGQDSDGLALSVFGNFVWLSAAMPALYALFGAASLAISRYADDPREAPPLASRAGRYVGGWALIVVAGTSLVICLGIYLTFAPVGSGIVDGLTGRYFLPPLLVALVAFNSNRLTSPTSPRWTVRVASTVLLAGAVLTLHQRLFA